MKIEGGYQRQFGAGRMTIGAPAQAPARTSKLAFAPIAKDMEETNKPQYRGILWVAMPAGRNKVRTSFVYAAVCSR